MQIVGVDFGTTNVRLANWDSDQPNISAKSVKIGLGQDGQYTGSTMPAVIAFQRQRSGEVITLLGEDADGLTKGPDTVIVRNIKRWALAKDPYVQWHLESSGVQQEEWWNANTRSVVVWDEEIPVKEIMRRILTEAFRRADITGDFEWRAGCPVHAGIEYRTELAEVLSEFGGADSVTAVVQEPVLFLELARQLDRLPAGSYLVYDVGGGSFDCAIAEVGADGQMSVYAAHGNPLLGGVYIDDLLGKRIGHQGSDRDLRIAKEGLNPSGPPIDTGEGTLLDWSDLEEELNKSLFLDKTLVALREAYITAKVLWKPGDNSSPISDIPSCRLEAMPSAFKKDLDRIILTGGPTKSPYFRDTLKEMFGSDLVVCAEDIVPVEIDDPELACLSLGACYMATERYNPLYVNRLPARVILQESDALNAVGYEPYSHFAPNFHPAKPFISDWLPFPDKAGAKFVLTIVDSNGQNSISKAVDPRAARAREGSKGFLRFLIDVFGRIFIDNGATRWVEVEDTPWQTDRQRDILQRILAEDQAFRQRLKDMTHRNVTENPYGWQASHG